MYTIKMTRHQRGLTEPAQHLGIYTAHLHDLGRKHKNIQLYYSDQCVLPTANMEQQAQALQ